MRVLVGVSFALMALFATVPQQARAQSACDDVRVQLEESCGCAAATNHAKYVGCVKRAFGKKGALKGNSCKKELLKIAKASICGRASSVICCKATKKTPGRVVKSASRCKKGGVTCPDIQSTAAPGSAGGAFFNSPGDVCTAQSTCVTTTTSSSSTTTTPTTSTTTTTFGPCDLDVPSIDFTTVAGTGSCGTATNEANDKTIQLACGGLNIGGGGSTVLEGPTPDGATNRFLVNCTGDDCVVSPTTSASSCWDCSDTGCNFGTPLPIENAGTSTCVVNKYAAPVSGNINLADGSTTNLSVNLASGTFLTGVPGSTYSLPDSVCPVCSDGANAVSGTPATPATGTCNGGARKGLSCSTTNSDGLTRDCPPGGVCQAGDPNCNAATDTCEVGERCADQALNLGPLAVDLTPLTTGTAMKHAADGLFCPGQTTGAAPVGQQGCFGRQTDANPAGFIDCSTITENGAPAGEALTPGVPKAVTLATVFCIPSACPPNPGPGDVCGIVDLSANLPGPGATSLPGTLTLNIPTP